MGPTDPLQDIISPFPKKPDLSAVQDNFYTRDYPLSWKIIPQKSFQKGAYVEKETIA